jgi:3-oxoacyl-[acyl-carrier protein] reductase
MADPTPPARPLEGQVALVTGAGRSLGRAFAERLASVGCRVGIQGGTLERVALVDEVARAVEIFAGPLGDFVSGEVLRVHGGAFA